MKSINDLVNKYLKMEYAREQAELNACQEIILSKISKSQFANNILLKGGVVMFNISKDKRRSTRDLDFDFIRYDISEPSIKKFIELLNKKDEQFKIKIKSIEELNQDDYKGKRALITISDSLSTLDFKLDIGVHTLLAIEQLDACFTYDKNDYLLKVNPPEQIFAEKVYALAKLTYESKRLKDIYDMYYLLSKCNLKKEIVEECFRLLTINKKHGISNIIDICDRVNDTFESELFKSNFENLKEEKWLDVGYDEATQAILDYIYSLNN